MGQVPEGLVQVTSPARNALPTNNAQLHQMYSTAQLNIPNALLNRSQIAQLNATALPDPNSLRILHRLQTDIRHQLQQLYYIKPKSGVLVEERLEGLFEIVPAWKTEAAVSTTLAPTTTSQSIKPAGPTSPESVTIVPPIPETSNNLLLQEINNLESKPSIPPVPEKEQLSNTNQVLC